MKKAKIAYTLFLMLFVLILLILSPGYDRKSALFPLLVSIATLALGLLALATDFIPRLSRFAEMDLFGMDKGKEKRPEREAGEIALRDFLGTSFWLLLILLLVFFLGFLISLPLWIFCYVHFKGKRPWGYSLITAAILWIFVYGFFVRIMGVELFKGILLGDIII